MEFLKYLVTNGLLKQEDIIKVSEEAKNNFNGNVEKALIERGFTLDNLLNLKSTYFSIPIKKLNLENVSIEALKYVPEESAKYYKLVPINVEEGVLNIGIVNPDNVQATDALHFIIDKMGMTFNYFLISEADFEVALKGYQNMTDEVGEALSQFDSGDLVSIDDPSLLRKSKAEDNDKNGEKIVEDAPIIKIVSSIIRDAVERLVSDIHIETTGEKVKVRFRLDGKLQTSLDLPVNVYSGVVARIKILSKLRLDEKRKPQDGSFATSIEGRKVEFRVSTFPTFYGEKVVMRILDSQKGVQLLDSLNFSPENLASVRAAIDRPYGIILITGPTGSGKSTTLFSMLNELDKDSENVVSLEDPVEYHMPGVSQSQVMPEIGYTFASGLRSILRQDPDVIMVGEIRDKETAQLAIQAALTGHLVFSTLHTNTSTGAIPRLIDMGVDPYLIAPTLICAIGQRLVRTIAPGCAKEIPMDDANKGIIEKQFADLSTEIKQKLPLSQNIMYEVVPTKEYPTGMKGRMAVFEVFTVDQEIQRIILKNPVEQELVKAARAKGMLAIKEDAIVKALNGKTTLQEAYAL